MRTLLLAVLAVAAAIPASSLSFESQLSDGFHSMSSAATDFKAVVARNIIMHRDLQGKVQNAVKKASPGIVKVKISAYVSFEQSPADALAQMFGGHLPPGLKVPPEALQKVRVYHDVSGSGSGFVVEKDAQGR